MIERKEDIGSKLSRGILMDKTQILCAKAPGSSIRISGAVGRGGATPLFRPDWNFEKMGIGGLDQQFSEIFRPAFNSRVLPPSVVKKLGIKHVKGIYI